MKVINKSMKTKEFNQSQQASYSGLNCGHTEQNPIRKVRGMWVTG
jgi:hypothetical protein